MLWRDQHMKTSSEPQSQVSLAASGGSKGLLQDSWSSKKRLPICLLTKKSEADKLISRVPPFKKKQWMCLTYTLRKFCGDAVTGTLNLIESEHSNANPWAPQFGPLELLLLIHPLHLAHFHICFIKRCTLLDSISQVAVNKSNLFSIPCSHIFWINQWITGNL